MPKTYKVLTIVALVLAAVAMFFPLKKALIGTGFTLETSSGKYTEGSDLVQNVQAMAERMAAGSENQVLQANSAGTMTLTNPSAVGGVWEMFNTFEEETLAQTASATNTLAITESDRTFYASGSSTAFILPATSTSAGVKFRFVIGAAIDENVTIQTSDGGNNIEGTLIVAGAVVDCAAEDTITFVADGENIGDYVEMYSNGTYWFIGDSGALTASKLTCTAS